MQIDGVMYFLTSMYVLTYLVPKSYLKFLTDLEVWFCQRIFSSSAGKDFHEFQVEV